MSDNEEEKKIPPKTSSVSVNGAAPSGISVFKTPFSITNNNDRDDESSGGMLDVQFPMRSSAQIAGQGMSRHKVALPPGH